MRRLVVSLLIVGLAACGRAPPPSKAAAKPAAPAPVATAPANPADSGGGGNQVLAPLDRAKAVEGQVMDAKEAGDKEIDKQSGGN